MHRFLVAGIVQRETIVKVDRIPVDYQIVTSKPDTIDISIGGDAYNISLALSFMGDQVDFLSMVGEHDSPELINPYGAEVRLCSDYILPRLAGTPTQVVLCSDDWMQQIFEDTKNIRDVSYDVTLFEERLGSAEVVVLSNANFCRPLVRLAKEADLPIAVNLRKYSEDTVQYNREFLMAADILYLSDDMLDQDPYDFLKEIIDTYAPRIAILGMGAKGVLLYSKDDNILAPFKSVKTNQVVNTVGAGNALFACFLHYYYQTGSAISAIKNALLFASYKIGFVGTSSGFMTEEQIEQWKHLIWKN